MKEIWVNYTKKNAMWMNKNKKHTPATQNLHRFPSRLSPVLGFECRAVLAREVLDYLSHAPISFLS
jgi:hypothetical protein